MREIKFRGYSEKMKIWCYGYYVEQSGYSYIVDFDTICETTKDFRDVFEDLSWSLVDEKSVGQYTGLKDKNGKEIYEGDIVKVIETSHSENEKQKLLRGSSADYNIDEYTGTVTWDNEGCDYSLIQKNQTIENAVGFPRHSYEHEVIGNIYENPELIEK